MRPVFALLVCLLHSPLSAASPSENPGPENAAAPPAQVKTITQYGITWTFEQEVPAGQFVTGDWWVVGPVTVVSVSPAPGPAPADEPATEAKSIYGATSLGNDKRLRNGSMLFSADTEIPMDFSKQGYDSRLANFDPALCTKFPCSLVPGQSLVSGISSENYNKKGGLATPYVPAIQTPDLTKGLAAGKEIPLALDTAAVLTCLDQTPPADAFRPSYIGKTKTIYRAKDIRWDLLPNLKPVAATPDWNAMARVFERPWLDHISSWLIQATGPGQNQPSYGGIFSNLTSTAGLMLLLDVPQKQKEKLMISYLQLGIDLHGLAECGRLWFSDGGHWMGRKWPIIFASAMLDQPALRTFPPVDLQALRAHSKLEIMPSPAGVPAPTTIFQEDLDTYYGKGADGQNVLWQVVFHTHTRQAFLEKPFAEWNEDDKFSNKYYWTTGNWNAFALAALYMKMKSAWNHDAYFDYCDWFMAPGQTRLDANGKSIPTRDTTAVFVQQMWDAYRPTAPEQPGGTDNLKWIWVDGKLDEASRKFYASKGQWVANPKP